MTTTPNATVPAPLPGSVYTDVLVRACLAADVSTVADALEGYRAHCAAPGGYRPDVLCCDTARVTWSALTADQRVELHAAYRAGEPAWQALDRVRAARRAA